MHTAAHGTGTDAAAKPATSPVALGRAAQMCRRCLYSAAIPGITFDDEGRCSYCALHDDLERRYPLGEAGERSLQRLAVDMRNAGRKRSFDCVVGVSGGCDSSFLLAKMVELGLRPLAVHFDNTWNSPVATQNLYKVLSGLGVELDTHVVNSREYDDLYRAFMLAGVRDIEAPTDIGLAATLYRAAQRHGVRYIVEGHSFRTEGISPLGWLYMDGRYIQSVHRQFGTRPMDTFPNLWAGDFLRWTTIHNIRRVRPLYHIDYQKEATKRWLSESFGWTWYGGHHLENRFTAFYHTYFLPQRYGIDTRLLGLSALVRSGQVERSVALAEISEPQRWEPAILALVKKRLGFSGDEFDSVMRAPHRSYVDFRTYKPLFESLRPLLWLLTRADRLPRSFYLKFALPDPAAPAPSTEPLTAIVPPAPRLHRAD